ncbi:hypothetical protein J2S10_005182 [Neobacillus ginsengisoli]|uniref:Maltogenic Amylase C-terminal domain-containing protein n=1 Tax=Neobacillus ginsengisoli TaxID=904295 RepID=A0ABT9Y2L0_9BACI|nr:hypothetical protein [Neobacillus ginsengisoli]
MAYSRTLNEEKVVVLVNLSVHPAKVEKDIGLTFDNKQLLLNNYMVHEKEPVREFTLRPYEARVYRI